MIKSWNPWSVINYDTLQVLDQSSSESRAKDRMWEIKDADPSLTNLGITNELTWNEENLQNGNQIEQ